VRKNKQWQRGDRASAICAGIRRVEIVHGNMLATAAGQLRTFASSSNENILKKSHKAFSIVVSKLQGVNGPNSAHVLLAYGSVVKTSFD